MKKTVVYHILFFFFLNSSLAQILTEKSYAKEFETRQKIVFDYIKGLKFPRKMSCGDFGDFGKFDYPKIISKLNENINDRESNERLSFYSSCPTFHFNLVGFPRIYYLYPNAPAFKRKVLLSYLNEVFMRTDSYNAWTAEGTENHINMSRTGGYLSAQMAVEKFPKELPEATERLKQMKQWALRFSKNVYKYGTSEWNSSTYGVFNIIGWLCLYDFAKDEEVKLAARAVLDYYATELALHYTQGVTGGSECRASSSVKSLNTHTDLLSWVWFGDAPDINPDEIGLHFHQSIHAVTSSYRPPLIAVELAKKKNITIPSYYSNSKPAYYEEDKSFVKQNFYIGKNFTLGAAYVAYGGWGNGNSQIQNWKLVCKVQSGKAKTALTMAGNGQIHKNNKGLPIHLNGQWRMPFDQYIQHKNVLIQLSKIPYNANEVRDEVRKIYTGWRKRWYQDFIQRFPLDTFKSSHNPVKFAADENILDLDHNESFISYYNNESVVEELVDDGRGLLIKNEEVYIFARSIKSPLKGYSAKDEKKGEYKYFVDEGDLNEVCGIIIEIHDASDFDSWEAFKKQALNKSKIDLSKLSEDRINYKTISGDVLDIQYQASGSFKEPIFDWGYGPVTQQIFSSSPPFIQPEWPSGKGHGKVAKWSVNGKEVDLSGDWPIYSGPHVLVDDQKLKLELGDHFYSVDYSGDIPQFTSK